MDALSKPAEGLSVWFAVLTLWIRCFIWAGTLKGLGIMLSTLHDQFDSTPCVIGWIASLIGVVSGLVGVSAGLVGRRFGTGVVIVVCGVMISAGFIVGSFATTAVQFACIILPNFGIGFGLSDVLSKEAVGRSFDKNLSMATGIAKTGGSFGLLVFAPLVQLFLDTYGWRGTMLLMGGISMHFIVCGALLMVTLPSPTNGYQELALEEHGTSPWTRCTTILKNLVKNYDVGLLREYRFWCVATITCCTDISTELWVIYFVSLAQSIGFSITDAATFVTVGGIGSLTSKLLQGFLVDRNVIPGWFLMAILITLKSVLCGVTTWLTSYWPMMVAQVVAVSCGGALFCLHDVFTKQVLGVDRLAGAFGWTGIISAFLSFSLGFLPGLMYDISSNYKAAFLIVGSIQFIPIFPLLALKYFDSFK